MMGDFIKLICFIRQICIPRLTYFAFSTREDHCFNHKCKNIKAEADEVSTNRNIIKDGFVDLLLHTNDRSLNRCKGNKVEGFGCANKLVQLKQIGFQPQSDHTLIEN